jgi:imidazolonepropionase-like amidohydrolase
MVSDAVTTMFGKNALELGWFVKAGMTPAEALTTATTHGAMLLGKEKSLGADASGLYADFLAVEDDLVADNDVVI